MKNIYLIGMPGCGKSALGRAVSKKLCMNFIDADEYIVRKSGKTIDEICAECGNDGFRKIESECLLELAELDSSIVATGGGIVTVSDNIPDMKDSGYVIFIDTPLENILNNSSLSGRPLLKDKGRIYDLYRERIEKYKSCADCIYLNSGTKAQAEEELFEICKKII